MQPDDRSDSRRLRSAVDRSRDLAYQMTDAASEALRARRDPAAAAGRRYLAAKRRLLAWSVAGLVLIALAIVSGADLIGGTASPGAIAATVLAVGLSVYCVMGGATAARDLRRRRAVVDRLPPPQPARRPVTAQLRPVMAQLDAYSDALRGTIAVFDADLAACPGALQSIRDETIAAADTAEVRLRLRATEVSALIKAVSAAGSSAIDTPVDRRIGEIRSGVEGYGRLVAAAAEMTQAAHRATVSAGDDTAAALDETTMRLSALAAGMRELGTPPVA